jgi:hypothetical protein
MTFLRRVLKVQAALWALTGLLLGAVPVFTLDTLLGQPVPIEGAWLRMLGVASIVLALFMVLVAQHAAEAWWWAWGFAILEAGVATVSILNALLGVPEGASATTWWAIGIGAIAFGALDLVGIARAGQEQPIV